jgi:hypothetical protein
LLFVAIQQLEIIIVGCVAIRKAADILYNKNIIGIAFLNYFFANKL